MLSSRTISQEILLIREGGARKTARQMNFVREDASFHARVPIHQPRCFGGVCGEDADASHEEDEERADVAKLINERFVPVKVDRDERPDGNRTVYRARTGPDSNAQGY